jgi:succinyl-CoA synthetase beta subunit
MRLLEYQGKELFKDFKITTPKSHVAFSIKDALSIVENELKLPVVLKSQVPVGGRGKAGGVKKCRNTSEVETSFNELTIKKINGEIPKGILVEEVVDISKELYISIFLNRSERCFTLIVSAAGGIEIESAKNRYMSNLGSTEDIGEVARGIASKIGLTDREVGTFVEFVSKLYRLLNQKEAELVEVNPAGLLTDGSIVALDSKIILDDNALFRHPELAKYDEQTDLEALAKKSGFSFVQLQGNIAIIGNGAGLVMSTLDMVSDAGGIAGAFLDFGGSATPETIYQALTVISRVKTTKAIVINLFGGIVKTDLVAQGILRAYLNNLISVPVFARISGAGSVKARELLRDSKAHLFDTIEDAIEEAVRTVKSQEGVALV